jgi:hypothetical protein
MGLVSNIFKNPSQPPFDKGRGLKEEGFSHPSIVQLSSSALSLFDKLKALSAKPKGSLPKGSRRSPLPPGEERVINGLKIVTKS